MAAGTAGTRAVRADELRIRGLLAVLKRSLRCCMRWPGAFGAGLLTVHGSLVCSLEAALTSSPVVGIWQRSRNAQNPRNHSRNCSSSVEKDKTPIYDHRQGREAYSWSRWASRKV